MLSRLINSRKTCLESSIVKGKRKGEPAKNCIKPYTIVLRMER